MSRIIKPWVVNEQESVVKIPDAKIPQRILCDDDGVTVTENDDTDNVDQAQNEMVVDYEEILQNAKQEAETFAQKIIIRAKKERGEIISKANEEAMAIRTTAKKQGYQEGCVEKEQEIDKAIDNLQQKIEELSNLQQYYIEEYNQKLKFLALEIAKKTVINIVDKDAMRMIPLVKEAVEGVKDADWVTIELSKDIAQAGLFLEQEYQKITPGKARIDIKIQENGVRKCILKSPEGIIDISVDVQLDNIGQHFKDLEYKSDI